MKSNGLAEPLDLERDLPTTPQDVEALKRLRNVPRLDFESYLRFLASFGPSPAAELRARKGPRGDQPFELV